MTTPPHDAAYRRPTRSTGRVRRAALGAVLGMGLGAAVLGEAARAGALGPRLTVYVEVIGLPSAAVWLLFVIVREVVLTRNPALDPRSLWHMSPAVALAVLLGVGLIVLSQSPLWHGGSLP